MQSRCKFIALEAWKYECERQRTYYVKYDRFDNTMYERYDIVPTADDLHSQTLWIRIVTRARSARIYLYSNLFVDPVFLRCTGLPQKLRCQNRSRTTLCSNNYPVSFFNRIVNRLISVPRSFYYKARSYDLFIRIFYARNNRVHLRRKQRESINQSEKWLRSWFRITRKIPVIRLRRFKAIGAFKRLYST